VLARVGHKVLKLTRIAMGTLRLGDLPAGAYRRLTQQEIRSLQECSRPDRRREDPQTPQSRGSRRQLKKFKKTAGATPPSTKRKPAKPAGGARQGAILDYDDAPADKAQGARGTGARKGPAQKRRRKGEA
jgi:23S rRNA pseudouridine2605 synthase